MLFISCKLHNSLLIHDEQNLFSGVLELIDVSLNTSETHSLHIECRALCSMYLLNASEMLSTMLGTGVTRINKNSPLPYLRVVEIRNGLTQHSVINAITTAAIKAQGVVLAASWKIWLSNNEVEEHLMVFKYMPEVMKASYGYIRSTQKSNVTTADVTHLSITKCLLRISLVSGTFLGAVTQEALSWPSC